jgi:hypothetical protein
VSSRCYPSVSNSLTDPQAYVLEFHLSTHCIMGPIVCNFCEAKRMPALCLKHFSWGSGTGYEVPGLPLIDAEGSVQRVVKHKRPLTFLPLVALIFYEVSGGPFGTEVRLEPMAQHIGFVVWSCLSVVREYLFLSTGLFM